LKESNGPEAREELIPAPAAKLGPLRRLYEWTIHWADTPYAVWALFLLAFAESSFFPIPPDVLLIAMALAAPRRSLRFALICTVGSVLGGILGYGIGALFFETAGKPILSFYGYTEQFHRLSAGFAEHGFLYIFVAALTPIPYKVFTIAAGVCHAHVPLPVLLAASVVGRGLRFFAVGTLFRLFGRPIREFVDRYFNLLTVAFVALLVLGFVCVRLFAGNGGQQQMKRPQRPARPANQLDSGDGGASNGAVGASTPAAAGDSATERGGGGGGPPSAGL
jgi:membrane protein YqaA with SNARE-associated domain